MSELTIYIKNAVHQNYTSPKVKAKILTDVSALEARLSKMEEQLRDIPGVNLQAKISVLRLWAEPEMDRRAEALAGESEET